MTFPNPSANPFSPHATPATASTQMLAFMQQSTQLVAYLQEQVMRLQQQVQACNVPVVRLPASVKFNILEPFSVSEIEGAQLPRFSGKMEEVNGFITACRIYIRLQMKGES